VRWRTDNPRELRRQSVFDEDAMKPSPVFVSLGAAIALCAGLPQGACAQSPPAANEALQSFEIVRSVLQHPRCQNCHIPGNAPLQGDAGVPHAQGVMRGPDGHGAIAMECAVCHQEKNLPVSYGDHVPPGAPNWHLPPPATKMVFIALTPHALCMAIKDRGATGGRNLAAMLAHIRDDKLVAWGWEPGGERTLPPVTRADTVAAFKNWMDAGAPCPG
jgi:hypothetical protein